ncbi:MAG: hypothetical protein HY533_03330 [Chloroflexi bacterium]|nr:hypothetical protein [Chloroflexota bacterium]
MGTSLTIKVGRAMVLPALGAIALFLAACSSSGGSSSNTSPPSGGSSPSTALAFDKREVDLGSVEMGGQGVATFLAINYGALPVDVGPVVVRALEGEAKASSLQGGVPVNPMKVYPIPIRLGPHTTLGPHRLEAQVTSTDPSAPRTSLILKYNVIEGPPPAVAGPRLRLDKQLIDGGVIPYDWPLYEQFTLRNDGDAPLALAGRPVVRTELGC